ncbi:Replication termination factor 2 [Colletotrichum gloeosporioides]|uniref:Replication termination factor 2 n=1 Tax=Colletotrichum gloeosporioides TaxID=474922 RepID=A0A8H4FLW3_COLGL|nr:Replication termination factor 2 [Colletotrichum gloeosporioides]KAF3807078.1 Replication termination factor 2 [Colletotrichum gloeosporioides]
MGNDGGSIPKRRELVKEAARALTVSELKANALESLGHAWANDPLSNEPLDKENVVSDWRGRLYNYETILQGLMPSDDAAVTPNPHSPELTFASTGIKSLRDIVKLKFHQYSPPGLKTAIWACPISLKELGPSVKAVYLVPCGHVFAEVAIKEIGESTSTCPECSEPFEAKNIVPILPTEEADLKKLTERMDDLIAAGLTHGLKKEKKDKKDKGKKKRKAEDTDAKDDSEAPEKRRATATTDSAKSKTRNINNPMAASLTAKVMAEQEELSKRRKLAAKA